MNGDAFAQFNNQYAGLDNQGSTVADPIAAFNGKYADLGNDTATTEIPTPEAAKASPDYITKRAKDFGLDPEAVMGVASNEGLSGGVGDLGTSFGPFQLHAGGALPQWVWDKGPEFAQRWSWSPEGIDYALQKMADNGARGLTGTDAVDSIVYQFERPANPTGDLQAGYAAIGGGR